MYEKILLLFQVQDIRLFRNFKKALEKFGILLGKAILQEQK